MNYQCSSSQKKHQPAPESARQESLQKAVASFQKGVDGDPQAVRDALTRLERLQSEHPDNQRITAYYGGTLCLLGRDQTDSVKRSANVIRGLKLIDQALSADPDNFEIRVMRGNICVNLPEMYFHRNATAVADCLYLIACYEQYPDSISVELYFQFLYNLCIAYRNLGENEKSQAILNKLHAASQDPKYLAFLKRHDDTSPQSVDYNGFAIFLQPLPAILTSGEAIHGAALNGGTAEIQKATAFFAKVTVLYPDIKLLKAYHADCLSLKGKTATNTGEMFANAIKAIKALDACVSGEPDNIKIRLIRVNHSMRLPELFFGRTATAIADLEYLTERLKRDPELLDEEQREAILYRLGLCYIRLGLNQEGNEIWQSLSQACGEPLREKIKVQYQHNQLPDIDPDLSLTRDREKFYAEARRLHHLGVSGNKMAAQKALELWEQAYAATPGDPVAEGFYGSSLALIGRDAAEINVMFGNGIKGLKHLNEALGRDSENWELRLLRAYLSYSLPEVFFHTTHQAIQDFLYLKSAYQQNNQLFDQELYGQILVDLEQAQRRVAYI